MGSQTPEGTRRDVSASVAPASTVAPVVAAAAGMCEPFEELEALRRSIDNLDAAIVHLLAERFKCTQRVGALKARHGMPASDPDREARQIERLHRLARDADLDPVFAESFLNFVIDEVIRHHRAIAERSAAGADAPVKEHPARA